MMLINHQALKTQQNSIKTWQIPQTTCNINHTFIEKKKTYTQEKTDGTRGENQHVVKAGE